MKNILLFVFITFFSILHSQVTKGFVVDDLRVNIVGAKLTNLSTKEVVLSDFDGSFAPTIFTRKSSTTNPLITCE